MVFKGFSEPGGDVKPPIYPEQVNSGDRVQDGNEKGGGKQLFFRKFSGVF